MVKDIQRSVREMKATTKVLGSAICAAVFALVAESEGKVHGVSH